MWLVKPGTLPEAKPTDELFIMEITVTKDGRIKTITSCVPCEPYKGGVGTMTQKHNGDGRLVWRTVSWTEFHAELLDPYICNKVGEEWVRGSLGPRTVPCAHCSGTGKTRVLQGYGAGG